MTKELRVLAAVDVQNLWHACRESYGDFARIDFSKLRERALAGTNGGKLIAYTIDSGKDNSNFLRMLKANGYMTKVRHMKYDKNKGRPFATNWDVGMTIDVLNNIDEFDMLVLVSGDGDFLNLVEDVQRKGKKVRVIMFPTSLSAKLKGANEIFHLGEEDLYREPDQKPKPTE